jgi:hypothetical protein
MPAAPEQKIKRYLISMKNVPLSIPVVEKQIKIGFSFFVLVKYGMK